MGHDRSSRITQRFVANSSSRDTELFLTLKNKVRFENTEPPKPLTTFKILSLNKVQDLLFLVGVSSVFSHIFSY